MSDAPPTSPPRPTLEQQPGKPDITVVLAEARQEAAPPRWVLISPTQRDLAIATITGLRESDQRRLQLINQAKGERDEARARCAELEAAIRRIVDTSENRPGMLAEYKAAVTSAREIAPLPDAPQTVEAGNG